MRKRKLKLHTKILIGLILGVIFGVIANSLALSQYVEDYIKPFGTAFIRLISMVVVPLVFASLLVGTASLNDIRKLGRMGTKTIILYICTTIIAITIGLFLANIVQPGKKFSQQTRQELKQENLQQVQEEIEDLKRLNIKETLLEIIPTNPVRSFTEGNMLQIIFFALLFGIALTLIPADKSGPVIGFFKGLNDVMIQIVHIIMKIAPIGVFALSCAVFTSFGLKILFPLVKYSLVVITGLLAHTLIIYPIMLKTFSKVSALSFFKAIRPAQLIAFSSSSSSATLPVTMECAEENLGISNEVTSFVLPLGATINMDGTALYQAVAAFFIAQICGLDLTFNQQLIIVLTATLASIGTAGVPGVGLIMLIMVLKSIGLGTENITEGLAIIWGIDRILDMCRTVVNITGDLACAVVVASTEGETLKVSTQYPLRDGN